MNPLLGQAIADLESKAMTAALDALGILAADLAKGKPILDALNDLAMHFAEVQASALDDGLSALGQ